MPFDPTLLVVGATVRLPGVDGSVRILNVRAGPFVTLTYSAPGEGGTSAAEGTAEVRIVSALNRL